MSVDVIVFISLSTDISRKKIRNKNPALPVLILLLSEPMNRHYFQAAIYLSVLVALTMIAIAITTGDPRVIPFVAVSIIIPFGIWIGSNFVRYFGAALSVFWAGGLIWPLISPGIAPDRLLLALSIPCHGVAAATVAQIQGRIC
jgi:hypothetical protein